MQGQRAELKPREREERAEEELLVAAGCAETGEGVGSLGRGTRAVSSVGTGACDGSLCISPADAPGVSLVVDDGLGAAPLAADLARAEGPGVEEGMAPPFAAQRPAAKVPTVGRGATEAPASRPRRATSSVGWRPAGPEQPPPPTCAPSSPSSSPPTLLANLLPGAPSSPTSSPVAQARSNSSARPYNTQPRPASSRAITRCRR